MDLPGYGLSGRPAAMDAPPADNPPLMRTQDAAKVAGQVVDFIIKRRGVEKTDLMGWSWGRSTMGLCTSTHTVMMEKNRMQFLHEVGAFLTEADPQALN